MTQDEDPLRQQKGRVARIMFVDTADDNYVLARWCFLEKFDTDFLWLSVHALEKYIKAVLLLNGHSAKVGGHDIGKLYKRITPLAGDLLPSSFDKPEWWTWIWREESRQEFATRLYSVGNEHNRYQVFGSERSGEDLFKLDMMVFAVRRLCRALDQPILTQRSPEIPDTPTHREVLQRQPNKWELGSPDKIAQCLSGKRGKAAEDAVSRLNYAFAADYEHHYGNVGASMHTSPLWQTLLKYTIDDTADQKLAGEFVSWLESNIVLPEDARKLLQKKVNERPRKKKAKR